MSDEDDLEFTVSMTNDVEADTARVIQMAALMLNEDGEDCYVVALDTPLSAVGTTLCMAASMVATLAEQLADRHDSTPEQVLLELRNWMNDPGENDGD